MAVPTVISTSAIAGPFKVSYAGPGLTTITDRTLAGPTNPAAGSLGVIGSKGFRQIRRYALEDITTDLLGDTVVDSVFMGGDMFLEFELEEANKANVLCLENPYRTGTLSTSVDGDNEVGIPGTFATTYAGSLVIEPLYYNVGNPHSRAGTVTTPCRIYGLVALASGFEKEKLFASRRRTVPIRLRCYPYSDGATPSKYVWYQVAAVGGTYLVSP